MKRFTQNSIFRLIFWTIFPIVAYLVSASVVGEVFKFFVHEIWKNPEIAQTTIFQGAYGLVFFGLILWLILVIPSLIFGQKISKKTLGLDKPITLADYGWGMLGLIVSLILSGVVIQFLTQIFPDFNYAQEQKVGFSQVSGPLEVLIAFFSITILPAIVEEIIARGAIYGGLREVKVGRFGGWIVAALISSLLFGAAHRQLNVGVVTFLMGLIMCFIREKLTDSIWAGIILHFLKNTLAFFLIFTAPILQLIR